MARTWRYYRSLLRLMLDRLLHGSGNDSQAIYARVVDGHNDLTADWLGWKQRGRWLLSPAGDRINPERMKGILWRLQQEERLTAAHNRNASRKAVSQGSVKVVVVDLADWHAKRYRRGAAPTPQE